MTRDNERTEKSRLYYFGEREEFATKAGAMRQAEYKMQAMLAEINLSSKISLNGKPEIVVVNGNSVQVQIPVKW